MAKQTVKLNILNYNIVKLVTIHYVFFTNIRITAGPTLP